MKLVILLVALSPFVAALRGNTITDEIRSEGGLDCLATRDPGTCEGQEEAWYYRPDEDRCSFFVYSGCGGNGNRFRSRDNCETACLKQPRCPKNDCPPSCTTTKGSDGCDVCACTKEQAKVVCSETAQRGYCRALHHNWAWSYEDGRCVQFVYGGCGGNENNFETEEKCLEICQRT